MKEEIVKHLLRLGCSITSKEGLEHCGVYEQGVITLCSDLTEAEEMVVLCHEAWHHLQFLGAVYPSVAAATALFTANTVAQAHAKFQELGYPARELGGELGALCAEIEPQVLFEIFTSSKGLSFKGTSLKEVEASLLRSLEKRGVEVEEVEGKGGVWLPRSRTIRVGSKWNRFGFVRLLAHETIHVIQTDNGELVGQCPFPTSAQKWAEGKFEALLAKGKYSPEEREYEIPAYAGMNFPVKVLSYL